MFEHLGTILISAFLLDVVLRDPAWLYHPVRAIGFSATYAEPLFRRLFKTHPRIAGIAFLVAVVLFWTGLIAGIAVLFSRVHYVLLAGFGVYLTYSFLALGSLVREIGTVESFLKNGKTEKARRVAQYLVSRDLSRENEQGITRATIEAAAENLSDGIIAPLFYYGLGGPILMAGYKVVNTLDSMVGYTNARYREFGWASARFDDVVNIIPARLSGALIVACAFLFRDEGKKAFRSWMRDGQRGPSPNGGIGIAAFAGARNIRLGGPCTVDGSVVPLPYVGGERTRFGHKEIAATRRYLYAASFLMAIVIIGALFLTAR